MAKKFWIDTLVANLLGERLIPVLEDLFDLGFIGVTADTAVDIKGFQDNRAWVETQIKAGRLIVEAFYKSYDEMTKKPFLWSSQNYTTPVGSYFYDVIDGMPNCKAIRKLSFMLSNLCIEKVDWIKERPPYKAPAELSEEFQKVLGLTEKATRSDILNAAQAAGRMDLFYQYNTEYVEGLARQHDCSCALCGEGVQYFTRRATNYPFIVTDTSGSMRW